MEKKRNVGSIVLVVSVVLVGLWIVSAVNNGKENERQSQIDTCINYEYSNYSDRWNDACGLEYKSDDCNLPLYRANELDQALDKAKQRCIDRYSN